MDLFGLGSKRTSETGVWVEDEQTANCFICACSFGFLTRRHHCRQCGQVVCDPCSQNRKLLESSRTGSLKRVCLKCWDGTPSASSRALAAAGLSAGSSGGSGPPPSSSSSSASYGGGPSRTAVTARLPDVPTDEAVAALAATEFEGSWEFTFLFTQVDLGPTGGGAGPAPSSTALALGGGGFANKTAAKAPSKVDKSVRENSKVSIEMELKTKGAAYFQGEIVKEFAVFGSEGKVTGALQRGTGKVSTTIQMVARSGASAVTTSFNLVGVINKEGVYSGTFSATEISRNAGNCSGLFKGKRAEKSESEVEDEKEEEKVKSPAAAKKTAAAAAAAAEEDDEEEEEKKKAAAKAAAKEKKRKEEEEAAVAAASPTAESTDADEAAAKAKRKEEKRLAKQKAAEEEGAAEAAAAAEAEAEAQAAADKAARKAAKKAAKEAAAAAGEEA